MTSTLVVVIVLSVLAALWVVKRLWVIFIVWVGKRADAMLHRERLCLNCFLENRQRVPADYEFVMEGIDPCCRCDAHARKLFRREILEWGFNKGVIRKV